MQVIRKNGSVTHNGTQLYSTALNIMHKSIRAVPIPGAFISGAFCHIVRTGGLTLINPGVFNGPVIFTSQHCRFVSMIRLSPTLNEEDLNEKVDPKTNDNWSNNEKEGLSELN